MELIISLVILFFVVRFFTRGLFDSKRHTNAQEKFDSIKKEKRFWYLMNTEDTINDNPGEKNVGGLNVRDVFRLYVFSLGRQLIVGDFFRQKEAGYNNLDKNIVKQKDHWVDSINGLRKMIEEKEKLIEQFFGTNQLSLTKSEVQKRFKDKEEESFGFSKEMEKFVALFLRLIEEKNTGIDVWNALKKFEEYSRKYEFDSAGENITDFGVLASVKMSQFEIFEIIANLLSEKIEDKENSLKLLRLLQEREQMEMLQWCMVNYSITWLGTNNIQRFGWRLINSLFL